MIKKIIKHTFFLAFVLSLCQLAASPSIDYSTDNHEALPLQEEIEGKGKSAIIETYLQRMVPGLNATYKDIINALIEEGHHVLLRGGAIRDLLSTFPKEPNDVDLDYTGTPDELIAICKKHHWKYTRVPKRQLVVIGEFRNQGSIDALPIQEVENKDPTSLEFTVNNIFYHCNTGQFLQSSEVGMEDLRYRRLRILTNNWVDWLHEKKKHPYYKIFRFWKMVGKGYIYSTQLQNFFKDEVEKCLKNDKVRFEKDLLHFLGGHKSSFNEIRYGAAAIMGYEWAKANILEQKDTILQRMKEVEKENDLHTYN